LLQEGQSALLDVSQTDSAMTKLSLTSKPYRDSPA